MSLRAADIFKLIEKMAPLNLAENWDNVGLLVGSVHKKVRKIILTLDVSEAIIRQAVEIGADLIVSHHPFPFQPLKRIICDEDEGKMLSLLLKNEIVLYTAHTNLDSASGGVNDVLAQLLDLKDVTPLGQSSQPLQKIVVFVPLGHEDAVRQAMMEAGAGHIGRYSHCSFQIAGTGTFLPAQDTQPFIGRQNELSRVEEVRLETIVPADLTRRVVEAMLAVHPYEEAAYDLYPLLNTLPQVGPGRVGNLPEALCLESFAALVKSRLDTEGIRIAGPMDMQIRRVAVCGGSGAEYHGAARKMGAQVLVTGDVKYHDAQKIMSVGMAVVDAGHFATEFPVLKVLQAKLRQEIEDLGGECEVVIAAGQKDVWRFL